MYINDTFCCWCRSLSCWRNATASLLLLAVQGQCIKLWWTAGEGRGGEMGWKSDLIYSMHSMNSICSLILVTLGACVLQGYSSWVCLYVRFAFFHTVTTHVGYVHFVYCKGDPVVSAHSFLFPWLRMWLRMFYVWLDRTNLQKCDPVCPNLYQLLRKAFLFASRHKREALRRIKLPISRGGATIVMMFLTTITSMSCDNGCSAGLRLVTVVGSVVVGKPSCGKRAYLV